MKWAERFRGQALLGVANQALTSAENFAVVVILVRSSPAAEYGLFVLGYGVLVLGWSVAAGLVTAQMVKAVPSGLSTSADRHRQYESLLRQLLVVSLTTASAGCLLVLLLAKAGLAPQDTGFWLLLSFALPGVCLRDFMRRYHFQERTAMRALFMDGCALLITVAVLGSLAALHVPNLHSFAVGTLAVGGLGVGAVATLSAGLRPRRHAATDLGDMASLWRTGRWNIGATLVTWIQIQSYTVFATAMLGLSGLASANAPRVLLTPVTLLSTGLALPLLPHFARQSIGAAGIVGFRAVSVLLAAAFLLVGGYTLALWFARDEVIPLVLGSRYEVIWPLIMAWAFTNVVTNIRLYFWTYLQATGNFRQLAIANCISAGIVLAMTAPLIHLFSVLGSVYAVAAGELILGMIVYWQCRKVLLSRRNA